MLFSRIFIKKVEKLCFFLFQGRSSGRMSGIFSSCLMLSWALASQWENSGGANDSFFSKDEDEDYDPFFDD